MNRSLEKIFFFSGSNQRKLLGILYQPNPLHARQTGIVYCHPFAEEKNMSHSVAVKALRSFVNMGYPVFRFDMSGCGDSEGNLEDIALQSWQEDLDAAIKVFKQETGIENVALFGLRLGGALALLHTIRYTGISFLILWEPVLDLSLFIKQFLRRMISAQIVTSAEDRTTVSALENQLNTQGIVYVIGYPITKGLFESFCMVSQEPSRLIPQCPTLILSISLMEKPTQQLTNYCNFLKSGGSDVCFDHINAEPFWDRYWQWECPEPVNRTMQWLSDKG